VSERTWDKVGGACGVSYLVITVIGWFFWATDGGSSLFGSAHATPYDSLFGPGSVPRLNAPAFAVAHWYAVHRTTAQVGILFFSLGLLPYMIFLGRMQAVLRRAEGPSGTASAIYSVAATVGVVVPFIFCTFFWMAAFRPGTTSAKLVQYSQDVVMQTGPAGCLPWAVMFGAVAVVVLTSGGLPRWLGLLAIPVGACQLLYVGQGFTDSGTFNGIDGALGAFVPYGTYLCWIALTGVVLLRRHGFAAPAVDRDPDRALAGVPV
jgi:hypothetical protein